MGRKRTAPWKLGEISYLERTNGGIQAIARTRFPDGSRHKVTGTGKTRAAARRALLDRVEQLKAVHGTGVLRGDDPAEALIKEWQNSTRWHDLAAGSRKSYTSNLDVHIRPAVAHLLVGDLSTPTLQRIVDTVVRGAGEGAAKTTRAILMDLGNAGVRAGVWTYNPGRELVLPRKVTKDVKPALTAADLAQLISRCEVRGTARALQLRRLIILMAATGSRPGEALSLEWSNVDLNHGVVEFTGTLIRTAEEGLHKQDKTKGKRARRAQLPPAAIVELSTWADPATRVGWVLKSEAGGPVELQNMGTEWRRIKSPSYEKYTPRDVRAAVGTTVAESEGVWAAAQRLGHADAGITAAHYVDRGVTAEGVDAMEVMLSAALGWNVPEAAADRLDGAPAS
jgi:integrase